MGDPFVLVTVKNSEEVGSVWDGVALPSASVGVVRCPLAKGCLKVSICGDQVREGCDP